MTEELSQLIDDVVDATKQEESADLDKLVSSHEPEEIALLLESLPIDQRMESWNSVKPEQRLNVLVAMRSDPRESILDQMSLAEMDQIFEGIDSDDLIELSESLPNRLVDRALKAMDDKQRKLFESAASFKDSEAGHWVNHEVLSLPINARVRDGVRLLRRELPEYSDAIFLVNRAGQYSETVLFSKILSAPDHLPLVDISEDEFSVIEAHEDAVTAAKKVQQSGFCSLPVVDEQQKFLGRLSIGDASEIVNEYYEGQLMAQAGMDEDEDLFSPVIKSTKNRAVWLGINLLTAFLASWFIGLFEATLQQVVALAVLMPIVASMGGIAGSQTLTLMIRGLALGQVTSANIFALLKKEIQVGGLNGLIWAIVISITASIWFGSAMIGLVIGLAILINIVMAALSGVGVPMLLNKLNIDPALSGAVILTTVTDIVGFVAFLGLGTLFLL